MKPISTADFDYFCKLANIAVPEPQFGVGRDLAYQESPLRTFVVHFTDPDMPDSFIKVLNKIFSLEKTWVLAARYKFLKEWDMPIAAENSDALLFEHREMPKLPLLLSDHLKNLKSVKDDLYVLGNSGKLIIKLDHHLMEEGLKLYFNSIDFSNRLLTGLNTLGAEMEIYYKRA
jgi:hypothetical protein